MEANLVKELEASLQTCITTFLCHSKREIDVSSNDEGVRVSVEKFLESARQLEGYFSKYQMYTSVKHPPDEIREDITKLREELTRKDAILNSLQNKTIHWNNELKNLTNKQNNMLAFNEDKK